MNVDSDNEPIIKRSKSTNMENDLHAFETERITDNEDEEEILSNKEEDDCLFQFPPDDDVIDMLDGISCDKRFPTITERYFTPYYKINVQSFGDDICILMHSNRICMLTLAPSHIALQTDTEITKIDFKVSEKLDRVLNKVSGRSKHGAQPLQTNSNICIITCANGKTYVIKCCIIGKLVEVNKMLLQYPKLLLQPPHKGGYLAIVLPNIKLLDKMKETLLTQEEYDLKMQKQNQSSNHV